MFLSGLNWRASVLHHEDVSQRKDLKKEKKKGERGIGSRREIRDKNALFLAGPRGKIKRNI